MKEKKKGKGVTMMTEREFLNAVIAETEKNEVAEFAVTKLQKMDARNAKRAEKPSKKAVENEPIVKAIAEILTDEPKLASEIAAIVGITTPKATACAKKVDGVKVIDVKVKGKGTQKGYFL